MFLVKFSSDLQMECILPVRDFLMHVLFLSYHSSSVCFSDPGQRLSGLVVGDRQARSFAGAIAENGTLVVMKR